MDAYEFNKIAGAILTALLVTTAIGFIGNALIHPIKLEKPAYVVPGVEEKQEAAAPSGAPAAAVEPVTPLLASASPEAGKALFKQCATCHNADKGGKNLVGPNLWDVVGRKKASVPGFAYSSAMQAAAQKPGDEGLWTYEEINKFIANPRADIPGTKMTFVGLKKVQDRANVEAFLRLQSDSPKPLP
jgi:cytochrome c